MSFKSRKLKNSIKRVTNKAKNLDLDFDSLLVYGVTKDDGVTVTGKVVSKNLDEYYYFSGQKIAYNPYRVNIGSIGLTEPDFKGLMSPAYVIFDVDETIYPHFLLLYLKSNIGQGLIKWYGDRGGVRSSLRISDLGKIDFPDITYEDQKRIYDDYLEKKGKIDELLNELSYQQDLIKILRNSILKDAIRGALTKDWRKNNSNPKDVENLVKELKAEKEKLIKSKIIKRPKESGLIKANEFNETIPNEWSLIKIVDICFVTKLAGFEYTKHFNLQDSGEVPVVRAQNVKPNRIDETNLKYIDYDTSKLLNRCALFKPSILMTFIGAGIGDTAVFDKKIRWHLAPNVAKLEPFNEFGKKIDIYYLQYYFMSLTGNSQIFKNIKATAQPNLSIGKIRDIIVVLPSINEQQEIVNRLNKLLSDLDNFEFEIILKKHKLEQLTNFSLNGLLGNKVLENLFLAKNENKIKTISQREKKYDSKTILMELIDLLKKHGKLHAEDLWKMSKYYDSKNIGDGIDKFYSDLKEKIEVDRTIKEVENEKGYLELL